MARQPADTPTAGSGWGNDRLTIFLPSAMKRVGENSCWVRMGVRTEEFAADRRAPARSKPRCISLSGKHACDG